MEQEQINQVEEEVEDESTTLILRKSGKVNGISEHDGHKIETELGENEEKNIIDEEKVIEGVVENEADEEKFVFYDRVEGIESESASQTSGENKRVTNSESKELDSSSFSSGVDDNYNVAAVDDQYEEGLEKPCEIEPDANPKPSMEIEHEEEEVDLINELEDSEIADYDVETVIQKQTTHDLYCPNCNSCITRRVILRKRKRRIRTSEEDSKRNKIEAPFDSKVDTGLLQSPGNRVQQTDGGSNPAQIQIGEDDDERGGGPDIFRCLSCFSFFLPTGDVFHLRIFGDRSGKKIDENKQATSITKYSFASVPASNIGAEKGSSLQDLQKPSLNGKFLTGDAEKLDVKTSETVASEYEPHTSSQLRDSDSNHLFSTSLPQQTGFTEGVSAKDAVLFPQEGVFNFLAHPNDGSAAVETSEEGLVQNQARGKNGPDNVDPSGVPQQMISKPRVEFDTTIESLKINSISTEKSTHVTQGKDAVITIDTVSSSHQTLQGGILPNTTTSSSQSTTQIRVAVGDRTETQGRDGVELEVIKSIVYGGLAESIASLSIVSSAAGGGAATLNVLALGTANLIGGLFIVLHNLWELRSECTEQAVNQISDDASHERDRYRALLGRRENFVLHAAAAVLSYIIFGLVPPVAYGFSFYKTDDKQLKLFAVAAASFVCIFVLAMGRAYVKRPPKSYLETVGTYIVLGFTASGVSYGAGILLERFLTKLGLFQAKAGSSLLLPAMGTTAGPALAYY